MIPQVNSQEEFSKLCENLDIYTPSELLQLYKMSFKFQSLNEMAWSRGQFIGECGDLCDQIHFNIINIVILGNEVFEENVYHWRKELMAYINRLYKCSVEKSVKKDKLVYQYIIEPYVDNITFKYDTNIMVVDAIQSEINKGSKSNIHKLSANYIKKEIYPNIDKLLEKYNDTFAILFKSLYNAFKFNKLEIFIKELDKICEK